MYGDNMKSVFNFLLGLLECVIIVFAVCMVSILFFKNKFGYTEIAGNTLIIMTDENTSELTHFKSGDLVIIKDTLYNDIKEGDEVYYYDALNDIYVVRVGVVKTKSGDNRTALYTFEGNDKVSIPSDRVLGLHSKTISKMGKVVGFLTSTVGFLIFVILPILVLFIYQVYHLVMVLKYDKD